MQHYCGGWQSKCENPVRYGRDDLHPLTRRVRFCTSEKSLNRWKDNHFSKEPRSLCFLSRLGELIFEQA